MLVALCRFDLRIPGCSSLKEKRHVLKTLIASLRSKFNVSVAEVDHHELWQRTTLAVSSVSGCGSGQPKSGPLQKYKRPRGSVRRSYFS